MKLVPCFICEKEKCIDYPNAGYKSCCSECSDLIYEYRELGSSKLRLNAGHGSAYPYDLYWSNIMLAVKATLQLPLFPDNKKKYPNECPCGILVGRGQKCEYHE